MCRNYHPAMDSAADLELEDLVRCNDELTASCTQFESSIKKWKDVIISNNDRITELRAGKTSSSSKSTFSGFGSKTRSASFGGVGGSAGGDGGGGGGGGGGVMTPLKTVVLTISILQDKISYISYGSRRGRVSDMPKGELLVFDEHSGEITEWHSFEFVHGKGTVEIRCSLSKPRTLCFDFHFETQGGVATALDATPVVLLDGVSAYVWDEKIGRPRKDVYACTVR